MSSISSTYSPSSNFWKENIQFLAAGATKEFYEKDKSKDKIESSSIMWCVVLIWERASVYYNLPEYGEDSKIDLLFEDVYGDKSYYYKNKELVDNLKNFFLKIQESVAQRSLREIEAKIDERSKFISDTEYTLGEIGEKGAWVGGTAAIIDGMLSNSKKIYELYEQALKIVNAEITKDDDRVRGGGKLSLTDTNDI